MRRKTDQQLARGSIEKHFAEKTTVEVYVESQIPDWAGDLYADLDRALVRAHSDGFMRGLRSGRRKRK